MGLKGLIQKHYCPCCKKEVRLRFLSFDREHNTNLYECRICGYNGTRALFRNPNERKEVKK